MVISISNAEELYYSTNRTTMVATIVLTIVPIEVALYVLLVRETVLANSALTINGWVPLIRLFWYTFDAQCNFVAQNKLLNPK